MTEDPRTERAMRLFARASEAERRGDKEAAEAHRADARSALARFASEKDVPEDVRRAAARLTDPSDENAKNLAEAAGKVGKGRFLEDKVAFNDKIQTRRRRMQEQLGSRGMDRLMTAAGGDRAGLGQALQAAMQTTGSGTDGAVTQEDYVNRMEELARKAADDPEKAAAMMDQLRREGLAGTDIGVTLGAAMQVRREAKSMGLKEDIGEGGAISDRARRGIRKRLEELGFGKKDISKAEVGQLIRGENVDAVRERLKKQGIKDEDIEAELNRMRGGLTVGEMTETGVRHAARQGVVTMDEKVAARAGLESGDLHGMLSGRGGSKAIVEQLEVHTQQFRTMIDVLGKISRDEQVPVKKDKKAQ